MLHRRVSSNIPMLQPPLDQWHREEEEGGEGEEGEGGMRMEQEHGSELSRGLGASWEMLSFCKESGGNRGDVSLEGVRVTRICRTV